MKVVEPVSSALLITGCAYAAGVSQSAALMRVFGINPAFSQPAVDKIFYDGGLIVFQLFVTHIALFCAFVLLSCSLIIIGAFAWAKGTRTGFRMRMDSIIVKSRAFLYFCRGLGGGVAILYMIFLAFESYDKAQKDGQDIAAVFLNTCHVVVLKKDEARVKGCAFSKDRDSIWYYTFEGELPEANSKLLSELDQITYLDPVKLN